MASNGEVELSTIWEQCSNEIKACLGSIVLPIGHLPLGLCRHRSLLFKVISVFLAIFISVLLKSVPFLNLPLCLC